MNVVLGMQTMAHSATTRECGRAGHLVVNSPALLFPPPHTDTHIHTAVVFCIVMTISKPCHKGQKASIRAESFTIMKKSICLSGRAYIMKIQSQKQTHQRDLFLHLFSSFPHYSSIPPLTPPPPLSQQPFCLFCCR